MDFFLRAEQAADDERSCSWNIVVSLHVSLHALTKVGLVRAFATFKPFDFVVNRLSVDVQTLSFPGLELANCTLENLTSFHCVFTMVESDVAFQIHLFERLVIAIIAGMLHLVLLVLRIWTPSCLHILAPRFPLEKASCVNSVGFTFWAIDPLDGGGSVLVVGGDVLAHVVTIVRFVLAMAAVVLHNGQMLRLCVPFKGQFFKCLKFAGSARQNIFMAKFFVV